MHAQVTREKTPHKISVNTAEPTQGMSKRAQQRWAFNPVGLQFSLDFMYIFGRWRPFYFKQVLNTFFGKIYSKVLWANRIQYWTYFWCFCVFCFRVWVDVCGLMWCIVSCHTMPKKPWSRFLSVFTTTVNMRLTVYFQLSVGIVCLLCLFYSCFV